MIDATRHESIFDPVKWGNKRVDVVGVGATGSKVALSLAKHGVRNLHIWDDDRVESHNLANQVYGFADEGNQKVGALAYTIGFVADMEVTPHDQKWDGEPLGEVVFCMVDSMAARKQLFEKMRLNFTTKLVIDSRMGVDSGFLLTYKPNDRDLLARYEATLFSDEDANVPVSACGTSITVGATGDIISGFAVWSFINHAAGLPLYPEISIGTREPVVMTL